MRHLEICLPTDLPTTEGYFPFQLLSLTVKFGATCLPLFCSYRPLVELLMLRKPTKSSSFLEDIRVPFDCKQKITTKY